MLQWKPMLAIQLSRQIRRSITYVQSDFSTFVGKLTKWLHKFMSFPAFQCFLTWKNMALKHICRNPGSTERSFDFFDFRNARISPKVPCHHRCSKGMKIIPRTSEQNQTIPPLSGRLLIACSIEAPAGNPVVGNRLPCSWKVNKEMNAGVQRWLTSGTAFPWHFWVALPCSAPQKHFKWCGGYFIWRSKACCAWLKRILLWFHPLFKLLFGSRLY